LSRWPTRPLLMGPAPLSPPAVGVVFTVINRAVWRFAEGRRSPQTRQKRPHRRPVTATPPCDTPLSDRASGAVQSLPSPAGGGGAQRLREAGPLARRGELPFVVVGGRGHRSRGGALRALCRPAGTQGGRRRAAAKAAAGRTGGLRSTRGSNIVTGRGNIALSCLKAPQRRELGGFSVRPVPHRRNSTPPPRREASCLGWRPVDHRDHSRSRVSTPREPAARGGVTPGAVPTRLACTRGDEPPWGGTGTKGGLTSTARCTSAPIGSASSGRSDPDESSILKERHAPVEELGGVQ